MWSPTNPQRSPLGGGCQARSNIFPTTIPMSETWMRYGRAIVGRVTTRLIKYRMCRNCEISIVFLIIGMCVDPVFFLMGM